MAQVTHACTRKKTNQHAFTLVELLVVIAIIGILLAILLPAVQVAREVSRRITCQNHLKQVGIAWQQHEAAHRIYPTGGRFDYFPDFDKVGSPRPAGSGDSSQRGSWAFQILPFLEQTNTWNGAGGTTTEECSRPAAAVVIPEFSCPSRGVRLRTFDRYSWLNFTGFQTDYGANAGTGKTRLPTEFAFENLDGLVQVKRDNSASEDPYFPPAKFVPRKVRLTSVEDGMPHTLMVAEKRLMKPYEYSGDDNEGHSFGFDIDTVRWVADPPEGDSKVYNTFADVMKFGSAHPGVFSALLCDGSVRIIPFTVDPVAWMSLGTISGGEVDTLGK